MTDKQRREYHKAAMRQEIKKIKGPSDEGKGHLVISLLKSLFRITGSIIATYKLLHMDLDVISVASAILCLAMSYGIAEVLGIIEELIDKR